jgi:hypothetical protein
LIGVGLISGILITLLVHRAEQIIWITVGVFYPAETQFLETGRSEKFAFVVLSGGVAFFYIRPRIKFSLSRQVTVKPITITFFSSKIVPMSLQS